jgi:hypothetical protein
MRKVVVLVVQQLLDMLLDKCWRSKWMLRALLLIGLLGFLARYWLFRNTIGCDDSDIWLEHSKFVTAHGVLYAYQHPELERFPFNMPPLMGYFAVLAGKIAEGDFLSFARCMKLPGLLVEILSAWLVWRLGTKRSPLNGAMAFAAYGMSLPLIAVSGFHCNTDCAYAGLTLLSVYLLNEKRRPLWSGLVLAAALNIKILPVLLIPLMLSQCRSWREFVKFSLGVSVAGLPYLPFVLADYHSVYKTIVGYNSQQLEWGIYTFLSYANQHALITPHLGNLIPNFVNQGRFYFLGSILLVSILAYYRPRRFGFHTGALPWAIFLVLTPGFGVQYSVSVLPLLFAADLRRATLYSVFTGAMLFCIYTAKMKLIIPLHALVQYYPFPKLAVVFGILGWGVLVTYVIAAVKELLGDYQSLGGR